MHMLFLSGAVPALLLFWFGGVVAAIYLVARLQSRR